MQHGSTPLGSPGRRAVRPKPGDVPVRATSKNPSWEGRWSAARHFALTSQSSLPSSRHAAGRDRKSTRLNSSHGYISYAVFCLKKKKKKIMKIYKLNR